MKRPVAPGLLSCLTCLCVAYLLPRIGGMRRAVRVVQRVPVRAPVTGSGLVTETARRVALAAAFVPLRCRCLEQSLALAWLLRRRGVDAHVRVGVQPRPFSAHAWVEIGGTPVNDTVEHTSGLQTFALGGP